MTDNITREKIVQAMYGLVAEKGYDKSSIGQIAQACGIQKASVYYYFKSKEDILMALVQVLYQDDFSARSASFDGARSAGDYQKALIATGEAFIGSYFEHQAMRKVCAEIDLQSTRIPALREFVGGSDRRCNEFLRSCMARGVALGVFPAGFDPELGAQMLYTALIGIDQAILYDLPIDPKAVWRATVENLWNRRELL